MKRHRSEYDWFGSPQRQTVMVDYPVSDTRPSSGCQMGRKVAFHEGLAQIDDDYVYRQEDFVLVSLIEKAGFKHGRVEDTFHYHQTMYKPSPWSREVKSVSIQMEISPEEEVRTSMMQVKGLIKYLEPDPELVWGAQVHISRLLEWGELDWGEFRQWVMEVNPAWWSYVKYSKCGPFKQRLRTFLKAAYHLVFG